MIVVLRSAPDIGSVARDAVRDFAEPLGARRTADACLLVTELVTNAYRHGTGQIRLMFDMQDDVAHFAVRDDGNATLQPTAHPGEHGGYGLHIVARIADRWGTSSTPTEVWFELLPGAPAR